MRTTVGIEERKRIGKLIAQARQEANMSQKELASKVIQHNGNPLTISVLSNLENGKNEVTWHYLRQIAFETEKPLDYFE